MKKFEQAIRKIASEEGISTKEVYREMQLAIDAGFHNPDPDVQAAWRKINLPQGKPRPEDVFEYIFKKVRT